MDDRQLTDSQIWYTRKQDGVKGPFPTGMVRRFVLLGRLDRDSEVSPDGQLWLRLGDVERLVPEEVKHLDTPEGLERMLMARLREDERRRDRRRDADGAVPERRRGPDRRSPEPELLVARRHARERDWRPRGSRAPLIRSWSALSVLLLVLVGAGLYAGLTSPDASAPVRSCDAPAAPGVDWGNCSLEGVKLAGADLGAARIDNADLHGAQLRGADLSRANLAYSNLGTADLRYADLRSAILLGTGLRSADLSNAILENADLSYADLRGAKLGGTRLQGARLGQAIWTDGRVCAAHSVGECH